MLKTHFARLDPAGVASLCIISVTGTVGLSALMLLPPRPSARDRLLDCAEDLFAEHGLDGVSLRAINSAAGLSPAALHYHFGSREALVEALLERRMGALMGRRQDLLDELEAAPGPPTARDVLSALVRPLAELLAQGGDDGESQKR